MIFVTFVFAIIDQSYDIIMIQNVFSNYIILTFLEKKTESAWHLTHQLRFILQCVLFRSKGKNISTCLPNDYHSSTFTTSHWTFSSFSKHFFFRDPAGLKLVEDGTYLRLAELTLITTSSIKNSCATIVFIKETTLKLILLSK